MAFNRPTLQALIERVDGEIRSGLGLVTLLRRSFLSVLARVMAGLSHTVLGFIAYIEKQAFPDTAEGEYLIRWAAIWGVLQKPATYAKFQCAVTGTAGITIPINTTFRRTDGVEYLTEAAVTLTGLNDKIILIAVLAGTTGEVAVLDQINILSPIAGLDSTAVVDLIIIEPEDIELLESLRARLVDRIQNPPSGGAPTDYIQWALSVAGITRAWVGPQALGPGTVVVYVVNDNDSPITPLTPKLIEVADYIETVRPVTANVSVVAPVLLPIDMTIQIKPNNAATQTAITTELNDLIYREAALSGAYKSPGVLHTGKILLSRINEAISIALGEDDHNITLINGAAPASVTPATGQLVVLGTITWQTLA
jgi:uncharacterized phage protein gp47/JayE